MSAGSIKWRNYAKSRIPGSAIWWRFYGCRAPYYNVRNAYGMLHALCMKCDKGVDAHPVVHGSCLYSLAAADRDEWSDLLEIMKP